MLSNYNLHGFTLKQAATDITPYLAGVLDDLAAEVLTDNSVNIFTLDREIGRQPYSWSTTNFPRASSGDLP